MQHLNHFLVCLDLTDMDALLIRYAANLCRLLDDVERVYFMHNIKFDYPEEGKVLLRELDQPLAAVVQESLEEKIGRHFLADRSEVTWELIVREADHTQEAITEVVNEQEVDLVLLGKKIRYDGSGLVGEKLLRNGQFHASLLLTPETAHYQIDNILAPIDFSRNSARAVRMADELRQKTGAEISYQHVFHIPAHYFPYIPVKNMSHKMESQAKREYERFIKNQHLPKAPCEFSFSEGESTARTIYNHALAERKDLIVVGSRGKNALNTLLVGSVALQLLKLDLHIPLLIIRDR